MVDQNIWNRLSGKFDFVSEGWSHFDTHYLPIFATFEILANKKQDGSGYDSVLFEFYPMQYEFFLNADEHKYLIEFFWDYSRELVTM